MIDILEKGLDYAKEIGVQFADLRGEKRQTTLIDTRNGNVESVNQGIEGGVAIRVLADGMWGFASISKIDYATLRDAIDSAFRMAKVASKMKMQPVELAEVKTVDDKVRIKPDIDPRDVSIEEKISILMTLNDKLYEFDGVKSCIISYADIVATQYYVNTDGTRIEQDKIYVWSRISATARKGDIVATAREEVGSNRGFKIWKIRTPESVAELMGKRLMNQFKAKTPKGGAFPAVLGPEVVGVFTHEAFGHLAEADLAVGGAVTLSKIGQKIASDVVTIADDGIIEGGFGSYKYDDEGVPAQKTILVDKGYITSLLYDREHAMKLKRILEKMAPSLIDTFNLKPTGNARAENIRVSPIIRMRNTYIEPGDSSFEELLEGIKFGYYLKAFRGGQANLNGTFQVGIQEAYEIVNGEIGEPVRNASISGNTLETLLKVDAVGKDFELSVGRCGKGQTAFIGDGGPHIRVKEILIGGA
ncbi:MAG: TldD/PmbA family protein [Candidatus Odinarchaeota archaeon]|nr:TldD/PmbA family protein [Candidatus Odinarchaeota archaeon]